MTIKETGIFRRCNWINQNGVQCGQPMGHMGSHGNGMLTPAPSRDDWHEYIGEVKTEIILDNCPSPRIWTEHSLNNRCLWTGTNTRCIYEIGHKGIHKEETINAD